jgi:uncharacterized heparinase superfamily protein
MSLLRYHRPSQLFRRAISRGRSWLLKQTRGGRFASLPAVCPTRRAGVSLDRLLQRKLGNRRTPGDPGRASRVLAGRFTFLNEERLLPPPIDWRLSEFTAVDQLWRFHLHYHEFLYDLAAAAAETHSAAITDQAWQIVGDWIAANPLADMRGLSDAWHPFCISRRVPAWIVLWLAAAPGGERAQLVLRSIAQQVRFLAAHLERDVGGNHLIENARALVLAGSFLDGAEADRWLGLGRKILRQELPEQVLAHGEHFERSPMYHAQMLDALLDIRDAVASIDDDWSKECSAVADPMAEFLGSILHPDGDIPLFGDSVFGESPSPDRLIAQASGVQQANRSTEPGLTSARRIGDYWSWRDGGNFLLLDAGPVGADHLPAHAHSDLLTIEASVAGRRFIVDAGVFAYSDDEWRRYCRSTAAHNVLQVDGFEQCETWSRFRMGFRGHPIGIQTGTSGGFEWVRVRHDAYRRLGVPHVGRWIACRSAGPWIIVDWAEGTGRHELCNWLHLHPDVSVERLEANEFRLSIGSSVIRVGALTSGTIDLSDGLYCPEFGQKRQAPVLHWSHRETLPSTCGWWLAFDDLPTSVVLEGFQSNGPAAARIVVKGREREIELSGPTIFG